MLQTGAVCSENNWHVKLPSPAGHVAWHHGDVSRLAALAFHRRRHHIATRRRQSDHLRQCLSQPSAQQPPQAPSEHGDKAASSSKKNTDAATPRDAPASTSYEGDQQLTGLKPFHVAAFAAILTSGLAFLAVLMYITADMQFQRACLKVIKRLLKTVALRQVMGILAAMTFVRFGLEPLVKVLRHIFRAQGSWEKSSEYYILREVCARITSWDMCQLLSGWVLVLSFPIPAGLPAPGVPLLCCRIHNSRREFFASIDITTKGKALFWTSLAGCWVCEPDQCTIITGRQTCVCESLVPVQAMVQNLVRATLSLTFVIAAARVVFNVKARMTREATWQLELKGDLTKQRRVEAVDKLLSVLTLLVASVFGLQAIGLDGRCPAACFSDNLYKLHILCNV